MFEHLERRMEVKKTIAFSHVTLPINSLGSVVATILTVATLKLGLVESKSMYETIWGLLVFVVTRIAINESGLHSL